MPLFESRARRPCYGLPALPYPCNPDSNRPPRRKSRAYYFTSGSKWLRVGNSKSETRNSKQAEMSKIKIRKRNPSNLCALCFFASLRMSDVRSAQRRKETKGAKKGIGICFGFRISSFGFSGSHVTRFRMHPRLTIRPAHQVICFIIADDLSLVGVPAELAAA